MQKNSLLIILLFTYINSFQFEKIPYQFSIPITVRENTPLAYIGYEDGTNYHYALIDINSRYSWTNSNIIKRPLYCDHNKHILTEKNYKLEGELCNDRIEIKNKKEVFTIYDYKFIYPEKFEGELPNYPVINFGNFQKPYILEFQKKGTTGDIVLNTNFTNFRYLGLIQYFQKIPIIKNLKESWKLTSQIKGMFIGELNWNKKENTEFETVYNKEDKVDEKVFSIKNKYQNLKVDLDIVLETAKNEVSLPKNVFDWIVENLLSDKFCEFSTNEVRCKKNKVARLRKLNIIFSNNVTLFTDGENLFDCSNPNDSEFCKFLVVPKNENDENVLGFAFLKAYCIYIDKKENEVAFRGFQFKSNIDLNIGEGDGKKQTVIKSTENKNKEGNVSVKKKVAKKDSKDDEKEIEKKNNLYGSIKSFLAICIIFAVTFLVLLIINKCNEKKKDDENKNTEVELVDEGEKNKA